MSKYHSSKSKDGSIFNLIISFLSEAGGKADALKRPKCFVKAASADLTHQRSCSPSWLQALCFSRVFFSCPSSVWNGCLVGDGARGMRSWCQPGKVHSSASERAMILVTLVFICKVMQDCICSEKRYKTLTYSMQNIFQVGVIRPSSHGLLSWLHHLNVLWWYHWGSVSWHWMEL